MAWKPDASRVLTGVVGGVITAALLYLFGLIPGLREVLIIPSSAVVAFDSDSCPAGWTRFEAATGRVVIGTGQGERSEAYDLRDSGGKESYVLTTEQLSPHAHGVHGTNHDDTPSEHSDKTDTQYGSYFESYASTDSTGAGQPYSAMQPWVALTMCTRDSQ